MTALHLKLGINASRNSGLLSSLRTYAQYLWASYPDCQVLNLLTNLLIVTLHNSNLEG